MPENETALNLLAIHLRKATKQDIPLLQEWDKKDYILASNPNDQWDWSESFQDHYPYYMKELIAEYENTPIGFVQIIDPREEETHYWGEVDANLRAIDIWIGEENFLRKGCGTRIMQLAFEDCFALPEITGILIDPLASNHSAHLFYQYLGFDFLEMKTFKQDLCKIYFLNREKYLSDTLKVFKKRGLL